MQENKIVCSSCIYCGDGYFDNKNNYTGSESQLLDDSWQYVCRRYPEPYKLPQPDRHWCGEHTTEKDFEVD